VLFLEKTKDYGTAWRVLRLPSVTDQLLIKAQRIRSIQEKGTQLVEDNIEGEFIGLVNYSIIALLQLHLPKDSDTELAIEHVQHLYTEEAKTTFDLLTRKNHDYNEAWRSMRITSMTDIILMKLLRIKQIEDNEGKTLVSEGIDANYRDIINYAIFCLIKMHETQSQSNS
jgi:hypothetical protein